MSTAEADGRTETVLVVDDDPTIGRLVQELLGRDGCRVTVARDGREALARVAETPPDLIVLDLDMPGLDGFEVCRRVKADPATRLIPVVIVTGWEGFAAKLRAWELGADDFLSKPYQGVEVRARCRSLLRLKRLIDDLDSAEAVVFALARAVEAKSPYTRGHSDRVTEYALALADELGVSAADREVVRKGAVLHDLGKLNIPDAILDKPGKLTPEEYAVVKQHPLQGVHIVEPLRSIRDAVPLIRWHHERLDGRGYPDGLFGGAIPLLARVLAVADVYDALASPRPYRAAMPEGECLRVMREDAAGGGLDPHLVDRFAEARQAAPSIRAGGGM
jgi:putative two-component system response regulator